MHEQDERRGRHYGYSEDRNHEERSRWRGQSGEDPRFYDREGQGADYDQDYGYMRSERPEGFSYSDRYRDPYGSHQRSRFTGESNWRQGPYPQYRSGSMNRGRSEISTGSDIHRQNFRGKGPKNFKRSDDRLYEDVCRALEEHDEIDATNIEIHVKECVVTLTGNVDNRRTRRMAEEVVENIWGVKDVKNEIRVFAGESTQEQNEKTTEEKTEKKSAEGGKKTWAA